MLSLSLIDFFAAHQNLLWLLVVAVDLSITILMYRFFGKLGLYAVIVLNIMLTNLQGPKLTDIFGFQTSLGMILYAGIYFATDLMSERYGRREANRAVMLGFATSVIVVIMMSFSLLFLPSQVSNAEHSNNIHESIKLLFNFTPHFVFASLFVYLVSQHLDVWIFHYIKEKTQGRHLWLRNNASTMTSQAVDSLLYTLLVWWPLVGLDTAIQLALAKYMFKVIIALLDTPFIYIARNWDVSAKDWSQSYHSDNEPEAPPEPGHHSGRPSAKPR